jgi:hypothetical protein
MRPAYFFFKYSSMALRMSAETFAPVFSDSASSFFFVAASNQILVRFMASPCMPTGIRLSICTETVPDSGDMSGTSDRSGKQNQ